MVLEQFEVEPGAVKVTTSKGMMRVDFYAPDIARVRCTLNEEFSEKDSLMVVKSGNGEKTEVNVTENKDHLELSTSLLKIQIDKATCALTYFDAEGRLLAKEPSKGGKTLERTEVVRTVFNDSTALAPELGADGPRVKTAGAEQVVDRQAFRTKLEFEWQEGEALYGLGSHEEGMMNLRGQHQYLYQQNMRRSYLPYYRRRATAYL
ncbi:DUF4968 domain-containing protein [Alteribacillus sp. HJP-4]|uniref:DUF4968 domain-containing protein n=1 Tax=Alteribacillus sp. HJP-4 TaxID=2775394 RepID=UPI0035CCF684